MPHMRSPLNGRDRHTEVPISGSRRAPQVLQVRRTSEPWRERARSGAAEPAAERPEKQMRSGLALVALDGDFCVKTSIDDVNGRSCSIGEGGLLCRNEELCKSLVSRNAQSPKRAI